MHDDLVRVRKTAVRLRVARGRTESPADEQRYEERAMRQSVPPSPGGGPSGMSIKTMSAVAV